MNYEERLLVSRRVNDFNLIRKAHIIDQKLTVDHCLRFARVHLNVTLKQWWSAVFSNDDSHQNMPL